MKQNTSSLLCFILFLFFFSDRALATCTPFSVSMSNADNNATAFTSDGLLGTDNTLTYYTHWDNTFLYLGWSGGNTLYSSDMYYAAIDIDPDGTNGTGNSIEGVGFSNPTLDYYIVYENNSSYYGSPVGDGNAFELYNVSIGSWSFSNRSNGNDNTNSRVVFSNSGAEVRLRIPWSLLGNFTPDAANDLRIVMWANNSSGNFAWSSFPSSNATGSTPQTLSSGVLFTGTGTGTCPSAAIEAPLPVELTSFKATPRANTVTLNWATAAETNNSHFEIERSNDSRSWTTLDIVTGKGTTADQNQYTLTDEKPLTGNNYYRLKQVDFDGRFEYSNMVLATINSGHHSIYPNPVTNQLFITTENASIGDRIEVYSIHGMLLQSILVSNNEITSLDCSTFENGIYLLNICNENGMVKSHHRFVKQ